MSVTLDFSAFSTTERADLLIAAKAELLRRAGIGSVQNGTGAGQSFGMMKMSDDALARLINSLTAATGTAQSFETRVRPDFSCR